MRSTGAGKDPYRLPTEAEYEYAARGGTTTTRWWGDDIGHDWAVCGKCGTAWDGWKTAPVWVLKPNPFGLYHVLGNVWEWTEDCWSENYENAPVDGAARRDGDCGDRVVRGGSWLTGFPLVSSAGRSKQDYQSSMYDIGFRVVRSLE